MTDPTDPTDPTAPVPADVLRALDAALGPAAVFSLAARGLIIPPGTGVAVGTTDDGRAGGRGALAGRVLGTLVGAELGWTLGAPHEWGGAVTPASVRVDRRIPRGAEIVTLAWCVEVLADHDLAGAPALAERLGDAPRLARAGNALPATIDALRRGTPWFEAGVGSYGSGAAVRAVAVGLVFGDRPHWRPVIAGLDAAVTHASADAVAVSAAVAEIVATLVASEAPEGDEALRVLDRVLDALAPSVATATVELARHRLATGGPALRSGPTAVDALGAAVGHAFAHLHDPEGALTAAITAGGDTDTVGALVGAFVGAAHGVDGLPRRFAAPRDRVHWERLAARIAGDAPTHPRRPADAPGTAGDGAAPLHVSVLVDRSGSMEAIRSDVVGGINDLLAQHRDADGAPCRFTIVQFDSTEPFEILVDDCDARAVEPIDPSRYQPRGTTPLYDAIGMLLDHAERRRQDRERAGEVVDDQLVVIVTDGLENASTCWTRAEIFRRIDELTADGWAFAFLGANQDSYAVGGAIGVDVRNVSNWAPTADGVHLAFASAGRAAMSYRRKHRDARLLQRLDFFEGIKEAEEALDRDR